MTSSTPGSDVFLQNGVEVHAIGEPAKLRSHVLDQIREFQPDWVLVSSQDPGQLLLEAALEASPGRLVFLAHTMLFFPFGRECLVPNERKTDLFNKLAGIITVSNYLKEYIREGSGCDSTVIPFPAYGPGPFPRFGKFDDGFITMVNPCASKGISIFLRLAKRMATVQFAAVPGWGTTTNDRNALAELPNVRLIEPIDDIDKIFSQTCILLVPSLAAESFGLLPVEAMLRGIPVVASDSTGLRESKLGVDYLLPIKPIEQYQEHFDDRKLPVPVVPEQDLQPWEQAISRLISDREHYEQLSDASRRAAIDFNSRLSVEPFEEFLGQLKPAVSAEIKTTVREIKKLGEVLRNVEKLSFERRALLALRLKKRAESGGGARTTIPRRRDSNPAPLSFAQQRMWFLNQLKPDSPFYNEPFAVRIEGNLEFNSLLNALSLVVRRHDTLRTVFVNKEHGPVQVILPAQDTTLPLIDLSEISAQARQVEASRLLEMESLRPFDLTLGPLFRAALIRLRASDYILSFNIHHIISDAWSVAVLLRDLGVFYEENQSSVPQLKIQYADYAAWQRQRLDGEVLDKELSYWRKHLEGSPAMLELPADRPRPEVQSFRGARHHTSFSESITESVKALSRQEGVTDFMTMLSAFVALLASYAKREDIVVGTDLANRTHSETERLIGFFVNLLPLRVDLSGDPSFRELLRRVRDVALGAYAHQEVPFEKLVEELQPERSLSHNPLIQVLFVYQNAPVQESSFPGLSVQPLEVHTGTSKFDLALFVTEIKEKLLLTWVYNTDLFEAKRIGRMASHYETLLTSVLAQPNGRLSSIDMLSETEKEEQQTKKEERQVSRLKNLMSARRQAVDLSETRGVKTEYLPDKTVPLVFQPDMVEIDLVDWARSNRDLIDKELLKHGALLFRGFDLRSAADFEKFAEAISPNLFADYGDLPREGVGGKVYGSTPYPSDQAILFHNESSHMHRWPMRIWFFCIQPSEEGGETPIVDCRRVYQLLDPKLRARFTEKKLMYVRNYIDGLDVSWQTFFRTTDKSVVEDYCRKSSIEFEWSNDRLKTKQICPAVVKHPQTNEMVFFNQLQLHHVSCLEPAVRESLLSIVKEEELPRNVYYGDGTPIEDSVIQEVRAIYDEVAVAFPWQQADVMMLNNMLVAHGRNPYVGPRKIVVAMGEMVSKDELENVGV